MAHTVQDNFKFVESPLAARSGRFIKEKCWTHPRNRISSANQRLMFAGPARIISSISLLHRPLRVDSKDDTE
jgi:hypothetical protein